MGARYTKNIPKSVYFCKEGAWWAGPFVHPQKGRTCEEYKLVPVTKEEPITAFSPELNERANLLIEKGEKLKKIVSELPVIPVVTSKAITQEELDRLSQWLKSDEGKQKLKEAQEKADRFCEELDKMFDNNMYNFIQKGI